MRKTIIVSDLTGTEFAADTDVKPVKITVDGKSGSRDLTPEETAALTAFAETGDASALRALLAPAPAPAPAASKHRKSGSKSGSKSADPHNAAIREWAASPDGRKALGFGPEDEIPTRGRLPQAWADAYNAAHGTPAVSPAPAASPAAA